MVRFEIPGEPRGKARPRFGNGKAYTDKNTVLYEQLVALKYREAAGAFDFSGAVRMVIDVYHPLPKRDSKRMRDTKLLMPAVHKPDADNVAKIICDALNGVAYHDDTQVTTLTVRKHYAETGNVIVRMSDDAYFESV